MTLALLAGGLFLIWKAVKEIHATVELIKEESATKVDTVLLVSLPKLSFWMFFDSVITAVGLTSNRWVIIAGVVSFVAFSSSQAHRRFHSQACGSQNPRFGLLIVIGVTIFLEGIGKEVEKELIYVPMGFARY